MKKIEDFINESLNDNLSVDMNKLGIKKLINITSADLLDKFPWILNCKMKGAVLEFKPWDKRDVDPSDIKMKEGTFIAGDFYGDIHGSKRITWKNGNFYGRRFYNGDWLNGNYHENDFAEVSFSNSTFHSGTFSGRYFQNSIFLGGEFNGKYFLDSEFRGGDFLNGYFSRSTFIDGTWHSGGWNDMSKSTKWIGGEWLGNLKLKPRGAKLPKPPAGSIYIPADLFDSTFTDKYQEELDNIILRVLKTIGVYGGEVDYGGDPDPEDFTYIKASELNKMLKQLTPETLAEIIIDLEEINIIDKQLFVKSKIPTREISKHIKQFLADMEDLLD